VNEHKKQFVDYIDSVRDRPFAWGSHDCLTFTNTSSIMLTGKGYADDWIGAYKDVRSAVRWYIGLLDEQGFGDIVEAVDNRLERIKCIAPPFGSLVGRRHETAHNVTEVVFGISVSKKVAFVEEQGLVFLSVDKDDIFWSLG